VNRYIVFIFMHHGALIWSKVWPLPLTGLLPHKSKGDMDEKKEAYFM